MVKFVVVVECVVKFVIKLKYCPIGTKNGMVVNIDSPITVVVCGSSLCLNLWKNLW